MKTAAVVGSPSIRGPIQTYGRILSKAVAKTTRFRDTFGQDERWEKMKPETRRKTLLQNRAGGRMFR